MKKKQKPAGDDSKDSVQVLLDALVLSEDTLVESALNQPKLFAEAAQLRMDSMRSRMKLEGRLKTLKADKSLATRKWLDTKGEKFTEAGITARVESDEDVVALAEEFREASVMEEYTDLLIQAFRARANSIRVIADLKQADVYHGQRVGHQRDMDDLRERAKQKFPGSK